MFCYIMKTEANYYQPEISVQADEGKGTAMEDMEVTDKNEKRESDLITGMPLESEVLEVSNAMKQLGDPSRLRIFWLLCHREECVLSIASLVDMSSPAVSHHLRLLKAGKLISGKRKGKEMYYKAADNEIARVLHHTIEKVAKIACLNDEASTERRFL